MAYRRILLCASIVVSTLSPAELNAYSGSGRIGSTSSASIRIDASVAPRMGLRGTAVDRSKPGIERASSFCIWSSSPLRRYTVTLIDQANGIPEPGRDAVADSPGNHSPMRLSVGKRVSATARSSITECKKAGSDLDLALEALRDAPPSNGAALLILAPE